MKASVLFVLFLFAFRVSNTTTFREDYCWRDYNGATPSDALAAGLDRNGKPIYVGQALFQEKLIPGKLHENDDKLYFEWYDKEYSVSENIKILCSQQPQKFEWIQTNYRDAAGLTDKILVSGGYERDYSTYIGRTFTDGETTVGKVICGKVDCFGLYTTSNGRFKKHEVFQILIYNPKIEDVVNRCDPPFDVRIGQ